MTIRFHPEMGYDGASAISLLEKEAFKASHQLPWAHKGMRPITLIKLLEPHNGLTLVAMNSVADCGISLIPSCSLQATAFSHLTQCADSELTSAARSWREQPQHMMNLDQDAAPSSG